MSKTEFVCTICTEEFVVSDELWADRDHVLICPCCGCSELLPLDQADIGTIAAA
jgi:hypothetical protein